LTVAVFPDTDERQWVRAIKHDCLPWYQVCDLRGLNSAAGKLFKVEAIPQNFLIDNEGKIIAIDVHGPELWQILHQLKF
jgi:hypothetical protein